MRLSQHFTLAELTKSQTATRRRIANEPDAEAFETLRTLAERVLEPLRAELGAPIIVTSGYRSPELNKAIGGSSRSMHCYGAAADIEAIGHNPTQVARAALAAPGCDYGRIILEFPPDGWVHIEAKHARAVGRSGPLLVAERAHDGRTVYRAVEGF